MLRGLAEEPLSCSRIALYFRGGILFLAERAQSGEMI